MPSRCCKSSSGAILMRAVAVPGLVLALLVSPRAAAAAVSNCEPDAPQQSGAIYRICMPEPQRYNGMLILFAHGYVAFNQPVAIPEDQLTLPDGTSVPELVNGLGFAFGVTSYSKNGLAVLQGVADLVDLANIFAQTHGAPTRVLLIGPSEGGIVTALAVERQPGVFDGGVAACGPVGDFRRQINYIGDFRVVFDVFFPRVLPGSAAVVPPDLIDNFDAVYADRIRQAIQARPDRAQQVLSVTNAPGRLDPANLETTFVHVLWYAVFATNDATSTLGGQPFDNSRRFYRGSDNDVLLNLLAERVSADPAGLVELQKYQTTGQLINPVITLHTLGDEIIPYWHEPLYQAKLDANGTQSLHANVPILRYGHCNFTASEALLAFFLLLNKLSGQSLESFEQTVPDGSLRQEFHQLALQYLQSR